MLKVLCSGYVHNCWTLCWTKHYHNHFSKSTDIFKFNKNMLLHVVVYVVRKRKIEAI